MAGSSAEIFGALVRPFRYVTPFPFTDPLDYPLERVALPEETSLQSVSRPIRETKKNPETGTICFFGNSSGPRQKEEGTGPPPTPILPSEAPLLRTLSSHPPLDAGH